MKNYLTSGLATWTAIPGCSTGCDRKFTGLKLASLHSESETNLGNLVGPCLKIKRKPGPGIQFSSWHMPHVHMALASTSRTVKTEQDVLRRRKVNDAEREHKEG